MAFEASFVFYVNFKLLLYVFLTEIQWMTYYQLLGVSLRVYAFQGNAEWKQTRWRGRVMSLSRDYIMHASTKGFQGCFMLNCRRKLSWRDLKLNKVARMTHLRAQILLEFHSWVPREKKLGQGSHWGHHMLYQLLIVNKTTCSVTRRVDARLRMSRVLI